MRIQNILAALSGALCLTTCASPERQIGSVTNLPDAIEYGRRMTIGYAISSTMQDIEGTSRCAPLDAAVIAERDYNRFYHNPAVRHSDQNRAIDSFITQQLSVCSAPLNTAEEYRQMSVLLVSYRPVGDDSGYMQIGHQVNVMPTTAFYMAADMAARTNPDDMWRDAFECRRPFTFQRDADGTPTGLIFGEPRCRMQLSNEAPVPPPRANPHGPNELESRQPR